jgi:hypothetical protein
MPTSRLCESAIELRNIDKSVNLLTVGTFRLDISKLSISGMFQARDCIPLRTAQSGDELHPKDICSSYSLTSINQRSYFTLKFTPHGILDFPTARQPFR